MAKKKQYTTQKTKARATQTPENQGWSHVLH